MSYHIEYTLNKKLPQLAWLAEFNPQNKGKIIVTHGSAVECTNEWLVEGVWDDDFEKGNFHESENFFGSGLRIDGNSIFFVPSSALTDRLWMAKESDSLYVSNSLLLILSATGAKLDDDHDYLKECLPFVNGFTKYDKKFKVSHPRINHIFQVFLENIILTNNQITFKDRTKSHHIKNFDQYYSSIMLVLEKIKSNYICKKRKTAISALTTISQGYDSTAVSSMVKEIGVTDCFTGQYLDRPILLNKFQKRITDNGTSAAKNLGMNLKYMDHRRSSISEDEIYFLAIPIPKNSSFSCFELSFHSLTSNIEKKRNVIALFTGSNGDHIWSVKPKFLTNDLTRLDISGLPLSEIRLKSGFINVVIPFIFAKYMTDIVKISNSAEMNPWRLYNEYDRPIPRRIAEEAGVERKNFGMSKTFVADRYDLPVNKYLRKRFISYLWRKNSIPPLLTYFYSFLYQLSIGVRNQLKKHDLDYRPDLFVRRVFKIDLSFFMSQWAIEILTEKIGKILTNK
jgi:hypothetical protein